MFAVSGCSLLGGAEETGVEQAPPAPRVEITFDGLDAREERNARAYLGLAEEPCDAPEWRVQRRFAVTDREIAKGLKALGHYKPTITKSLNRSDTCWNATFTVDPGPPVTVSAVDVSIDGEAGDDPAFRALLADLPMKTGEVLDHGAYESLKTKLSSLASARGYQEARLTRSELRVDPAAGTAVALVTLQSGPRYRLGELRVEVEGVEENLVRRIAEYEAGQPYSADRLHNINQALSDSGYFANVEVRPEPESASDLTVPVTVRAEPRKRHLYTAGVGLDTDTGPRLRLGYENRRINRRGHRLVSRLLASPVLSDLTTEYRVPLDRPRSEWLTFYAAASHEDTDTFDSTAGRLGVRSTHLRGKWLETRFLDLSREDYQVGDTDRTSTFLTPGLSYQRIETDGSLRPSHGWRLSAEVRGGTESVLSETNVIRARVRGGWLRGLPWGGRIITRGELGALAVTDFDALPPSLRFFAGGDNSVRGYEFESLGPKDASGEVIGGRYLAVASLEYEHPLFGAWSAAAFVDVGNAFANDFNDGLKTGVGVGLRWQSPVGPMRVDLAHPLDDDGTTIRVHLRLGPDL